KLVTGVQTCALPISSAGSTSYGASSFEALRKVDPEIYDAIRAEEKRQRENIELIASENFTSRAVMEAQGSCLTNKYAEGYPKKQIGRASCRERAKRM